MSLTSSLRRTFGIAGLITVLTVEVGMAGMMFVTRRDASKKIFKRTLSDQELPAEVIQELSEAYNEGQIHLREIVRSSAPW
jgi:hypothetical protein